MSLVPTIRTLVTRHTCFIDYSKVRPGMGLAEAWEAIQIAGGPPACLPCWWQVTMSRWRRRFGGRSVP